MRKNVLLFVMASILMSLCIPMSAQQPQDSAHSVHPFFNRAIFDETASPEEIVRNNPDLIQFNENGTLVLHGKEVHQMVVNGKVVYSEDDTITDPPRLLKEINRRIIANQNVGVESVDDSVSRITLPVSLPKGETIQDKYKYIKIIKTTKSRCKTVAFGVHLFQFYTFCIYSWS